jgi:hypothetical protein
MQGSKKYRRRYFPSKYYQIQIWSDHLKEWLWVGRFIKERWYKIMFDCIEKRTLCKNTPKGRKHAGKFYMDDRQPPVQFFREKLSEQNDVSTFWTYVGRVPSRLPNPIDYYKGYSQIRFITLNDNKYYLFKYNPIKLNFGVKEYMLVKINKFNKNNCKLV